jgi:hypothetical protein
VSYGSWGFSDWKISAALYNGFAIQEQTTYLRNDLSRGIAVVVVGIRAGVLPGSHRAGAS